MTHDDLATLLRDHVSHDEPPAPAPGRALTDGRRRLRARRVAVVGGTAAALALAGVGVAHLIAGDDGPDAGVDPASATALADYDVARMPALMDDHVRAVLERSVADLGPATFTARDAQWIDLPERYWAKASGLRVSYGSADHEWTASLSHSRGEAEGDHDRSCRDDVDNGYFLECTARRSPAGDAVVTRLTAVRPVAGGSWQLVSREQLDTVPLDRLSFERTVKVVKSETLITYVTERVRATDRDPATAAFSTPYDDLVEIGTDPELVMPPPPPGENGCPAWSLPPRGVLMSCGTVPTPTPEEGLAPDGSAPTPTGPADAIPTTSGG